MTDALVIIAAAAIVYAADVLRRAFRLRRERDALRAERDALRVRSAEQSRQLRQMRDQCSVAAANLVQLSAALQQAAQQQGDAVSVPPAMRFWVN